MCSVARLRGMPACWSRIHICAKMLSTKRSSRVPLINQSMTASLPERIESSLFGGAVIFCPWAAVCIGTYRAAARRRQPCQLHGLCAPAHQASCSLAGAPDRPEHRQPGNESELRGLGQFDLQRAAVRDRKILAIETDAALAASRVDEVRAGGKRPLAGFSEGFEFYFDRTAPRHQVHDLDWTGFELGHDRELTGEADGRERLALVEFLPARFQHQPTPADDHLQTVDAWHMGEGAGRHDRRRSEAPEQAVPVLPRRVS